MNDKNKRENVLSWNDYFMGIAKLSSKRSKDPNTQVGACIVNDLKHIVGIGYNGLPNGCDDDNFPWGKNEDEINSKYLYVCHAELNAILNSSTSLRGTSLYTTLFPCNECAKAIIQSGITNIYFLDNKYHNSNASIAARKMFDASGVIYTQLSEEIC